jgi:hypothetical protein
MTGKGLDIHQLLNFLNDWRQFLARAYFDLKYGVCGMPYFYVKCRRKLAKGRMHQPYISVNEPLSSIFNGPFLNFRCINTN